MLTESTATVQDIPAVGLRGERGGQLLRKCSRLQSLALLLFPVGQQLETGQVNAVRGDFVSSPLPYLQSCRPLFLAIEEDVYPEYGSDWQSNKTSFQLHHASVGTSFLGNAFRMDARFR